MVRAWFFQDSEDDQFAPHQGPEVSLETLKNVGVLYWKLDADNYQTDGQLEQICRDRKYKNRDQVTITAEFPAEKLKTFFEEHLHDDEEIRFILDGSGYFDVRDPQDRWIRIEVLKDDMIIVPAGIFHRFSPDANKFIKALRLFQDEPKWIPIARTVAEVDGTPVNAARISYLTTVALAVH